MEDGGPMVDPLLVKDGLWHHQRIPTSVSAPTIGVTQLSPTRGQRMPSTFRLGIFISSIERGGSQCDASGVRRKVVPRRSVRDHGELTRIIGCRAGTLPFLKGHPDHGHTICEQGGTPRGYYQSPDRSGDWVLWGVLLWQFQCPGSPPGWIPLFGHCPVR